MNLGIPTSSLRIFVLSCDFPPRKAARVGCLTAPHVESCPFPATVPTNSRGGQQSLSSFSGCRWHTPGVASGSGGLDLGRRGPTLPRPLLRLGAVDVGPLSSGDPPGRSGGTGRRHRIRSLYPLGRSVGRSHLRGLPQHGAGATRQFGSRSRSQRTASGSRMHSTTTGTRCFAASCRASRRASAIFSGSVTRSALQPRPSTTATWSTP